MKESKYYIEDNNKAGVILKNGDNWNIVATANNEFLLTSIIEDLKKQNGIDADIQRVHIIKGNYRI